MSQSHNIGDAGEFYVAYKLAIAGYNVGLTIGNRPGVDLIISSGNGLKSISVQVKTSSNAHRRRRYGIEGYEWDVNSGVIGRHSLEFWYIFVDLRWDNATPDLFIVPSYWVSEFVKPNFSRKMFFLPKRLADELNGDLNLLSKFMNEDKETLKWASEWNEKLIRWGEE